MHTHPDRAATSPTSVAHVSSSVPFQRSTLVIHADALVVPGTKSIDDHAWHMSMRRNHDVHAVITNPELVDEDLRMTAHNRHVDVIWYNWTVGDVVDHIRARTEQPHMCVIVSPADALQISKRHVHTEIIVRYGMHEGQIAVARL